MVAGAVIGGFDAMRGDRPGGVVAVGGLGFPDRVVSVLVFLRGRMMWVRLGRPVFARGIVGRMMDAGQAPGVRGE